MKSGIMDDYIFLDFRRAVPKQPHPSTASGLSLTSTNLFPDIANLFHVVFDDQYQTATIYNKNVQQLIKILLLETHN